MIHTRKELNEYLLADSRNYYLRQMGLIARLKAHLFDTPISDQVYIWRYVYTMRHLEYHINNQGLLHKILHIFYAMRLRKYAVKTGFQIPPNTCGKGLLIWHWGPIIINPKTVIGENCTLHPMIVIGHKKNNGNAPSIGHNVTVSGGVNIIGAISIGNNVIIAPGASVCKDVPSDSVVGGVPAKVIRKTNG